MRPRSSASSTSRDMRGESMILMEIWILKENPIQILQDDPIRA